ncbi:MAG: thioredoxin [Candidatus Aenigmarchaeota archaeon]|nr:thioredoxin [Candidatus Aenigmarchaeota archaeon]
MVLKIDNENFEKEVLRSDIPVIVDFWAEWCGPCKILGPIFEKISEEYEGKLKFVKMNVDENQDIAGKFSIQGIPSMLIFNKGEEAERLVGALPETLLKEKIDTALSNLQ